MTTLRSPIVLALAAILIVGIGVGVSQQAEPIPPGKSKPKKGKPAKEAPAAGKKLDKQPLILAHYMPWFAAKPVSKKWGWHWTMNKLDPDKKVGDKREIAAHYYPLIGPYDSNDPAVIEYHLLLMKLAGIDGLVVDWYGRTDLHDYLELHRNTTSLMQPAAKLGLKMCICYEDQTIPKLMGARKIPKDGVKHAKSEIDWLRSNWFTEPNYLKYDGKPVLLSFGFSGLSDEEWDKVLPKGTGDLVYLSEHRRRTAAEGAFDWPVPRQGLKFHERWYKQSEKFPIRMPVAYPRFHDFYKQAKVGAGYGKVGDDNGRTFTRLIEQAMTSGAPFLQLATWNDWGEGTMIEPSVEFGYRDLEVIQQMRRKLFDAGFAFKTDDLRLAHRLFLLRQQDAKQSGRSSQLDKIAGLISSGSVAEAAAELKRIEMAR